MLYGGGRWEVGVWWEVVDGGGVYGNFDMISVPFPIAILSSTALPHRAPRHVEPCMDESCWSP